MASLFKRLKKTLTKMEKRLPAPLERAANTMLNPARSYATFLSDQSNCSDWACRRAALRRHHERETTPWTKTAKQSRTADELISSGIPAQVEQGMMMRAEVDEATLKRGVVGLSVASVVVPVAYGAAIGGVASQAGKTGAKDIAGQYYSLMPEGTPGLYEAGYTGPERTGPMIGGVDAGQERAGSSGTNGAGGLLLVGGLILLKLLVA